MQSVHTVTPQTSILRADETQRHLPTSAASITGIINRSTALPKSLAINARATSPPRPRTSAITLLTACCSHLRDRAFWFSSDVAFCGPFSSLTAYIVNATCTFSLIRSRSVQLATAATALNEIYISSPLLAPGTLNHNAIPLRQAETLLRAIILYIGSPEAERSGHDSLLREALAARLLTHGENVCQLARIALGHAERQCQLLALVQKTILIRSEQPGAAAIEAQLREHEARCHNDLHECQQNVRLARSAVEQLPRLASASHRSQQRLDETHQLYSLARGARIRAKANLTDTKTLRRILALPSAKASHRALNRIRRRNDAALLHAGQTRQDAVRRLADTRELGRHLRAGPPLMLATFLAASVESRLLALHPHDAPPSPATNTADELRRVARAIMLMHPLPTGSDRLLAAFRPYLYAMTWAEPAAPSPTQTSVMDAERNLGSDTWKSAPPDPAHPPVSGYRSTMLNSSRCPPGDSTYYADAVNIPPDMTSAYLPPDLVDHRPPQPLPVVRFLEGHTLNARSWSDDPTDWPEAPAVRENTCVELYLPLTQRYDLTSPVSRGNNRTHRASQTPAGDASTLDITLAGDGAGNPYLRTLFSSGGSAVTLKGVLTGQEPLQLTHIATQDEMGPVVPVTMLPTKSMQQTKEYAPGVRPYERQVTSDSQESQPASFSRRPTPFETPTPAPSQKLTLMGLSQPLSMSQLNHEAQFLSMSDVLSFGKQIGRLVNEVMNSLPVMIPVAYADEDSENQNLLSTGNQERSHHNGSRDITENSWSEFENIIATPVQPVNASDALADDIESIKIIIDNKEYSVFTPSRDAPFCLEGPMVPATPLVIMTDLSDGIRQIEILLNHLPSYTLQLKIDAFVLSEHLAPPEAQNPQYQPLKRTLAVCAHLLKWEPVRQSWYANDAATWRFMTSLLADSAFDSTTAVADVFQASPAAERALTNLLLQQLDRLVPQEHPLMTNISTSELATLETAKQGGYYRLNRVLLDLCLTYKSRFSSATQETHDRSLINVAVAWYQRKLLIDYPFLRLRNWPELKTVPPFSYQGLLINLAASTWTLRNQFRLDSVPIETLSRLGAGMLMNTSPNTLLNEFGSMEAAYVVHSSSSLAGIVDHIVFLKQENVALLNYFNSWQRLNMTLSRNITSVTQLNKPLNQLKSDEKLLCALRLQTLPPNTQKVFLKQLHQTESISMQFIDMSVIALGDRAACIGFILSCIPHDEETKHDYFISLMPSRNITVSPVAMDISAWLTDREQREYFINHEGKIRLLNLILPGAPSETYTFNLRAMTSLELNPGDRRDWPHVSTVMADMIVEQQFVELPPPPVAVNAPDLTAAPLTDSPLLTWASKVALSLFESTWLGACLRLPGEGVEAVKQKFSLQNTVNSALDVTSCITGLPLGSDEEKATANGLIAGSRSVISVVKKVMEDMSGDDSEQVENTLSAKIEGLKQNIRLAEAQPLPDACPGTSVKHGLGMLECSRYLDHLEGGDSVAVSSLKLFYRSSTVWWDDDEGCLYAIFTNRAGGEETFIYDQVQDLFMPTKHRLLTRVHQQQPVLLDLNKLTDLIHIRNITALRKAIIAKQQMARLRAAGETAPPVLLLTGTVVIREAQPERYYPGIPDINHANRYLITPRGWPVDEYLVIDLEDQQMHFVRDNAIHFRVDREIRALEQMESLKSYCEGHLENIPSSWTLNTIYIRHTSESDSELMLEWREDEHSYFRQLSPAGSWQAMLPKALGCMPSVRNKRQPPEMVPMIDLESCGFIDVGRAEVERAAAHALLAEKAQLLKMPPFHQHTELLETLSALVERYEEWITIDDEVRKELDKILHWEVNVKDGGLQLIEIKHKVENYFKKFDLLKGKERTGRTAFQKAFGINLSTFFSDFEKLIGQYSNAQYFEKEFKTMKDAYYHEHLESLLKANSMLNNALYRIRHPSKKILGGIYIVEADTPEKILKKYPLQHHVYKTAIAELNQQAQSVLSVMDTPQYSTFFATHFQGFMGRTIIPGIIKNAESDMRLYLKKIKRLRIEQITLIRDRFSEGGRIASSCLCSSLEKYLYGASDAIAFTYLHDQRERIYFKDFISNTRFAVTSLSHEASHHYFDNPNKASGFEIYLNEYYGLYSLSDVGKAYLSRKLINDKHFFCWYLWQDRELAKSFVIILNKLSSKDSDKRLAKQFHSDYFEVRDDNILLRTSYSAVRKERFKQLVDLLFSDDQLFIDFINYNGDYISGFFSYLVEKASQLSDPEALIRRKRESQNPPLVEGILMSLVWDHVQAIEILPDPVAPKVPFN